VKVKINNDNKDKVNFIFKPNDSFKSKWDILIMISAVFNCFTIPFKVAYQPPFMEAPSYGVLNNIIDFVFLIDIMVTFRTAFVDDFGVEVFLPCDIAKSYISG